MEFISRDEYIQRFNDCLKGKELYLFGAGHTLDLTFSYIKEYQIKGVFDNDSTKTGGKIHNISIMKIDFINALDRDSTVFLITAMLYCAEIEQQLRKLGFQHIFTISFFRSNPTHPPFSYEELKKVEQLKGLVHDEASKEVLEWISVLRKNRSVDYRRIYEPRQYAIIDNWAKFTAEETFVDLGAYTGDTIETFKKCTNHAYKKIFAFEPDPNNYAILLEYAADDPRIECLPYGAWDEDQELFFSGEKGCGRLGGIGDVSTKVYRLDSLIKERVTFIKMDIEGAELKALRGAKNLIRKYKPKLAICIYHKPQDIWEIPLYIHSIVPEYKLYICHHEYGYCETVVYAVP